MSMEPIAADPALMQQMAAKHDDASAQITNARGDHGQVLTAADSWGPLFYESRRAAQEAVEAREAALTVQAERHTKLADELRRGGAKFAEMNQRNAENLGNIAT
ncbi:type VII secretion target [Mycolicibacterium mucogenicum]|uniref:type VII secretion target n=2 Tax=Mycolicibacterium mucogenicum TaxID=56689 RepID=UPI0009EC9FB0|nr:type VII secretion target [Mycolicibacterium mucogenicum]KAB7757475.1 hypothetical protein MMUC44124_15320 [Mycolicibacterium mucogenicum DSM 44124]